jgi:two-component system sensor histidine kinase RegB
MTQKRQTPAADDPANPGALSVLANKPKLQGLELNLVRLLLIRAFALIGQTAAVIYAARLWPDALSYSAITAGIVALTLITALSVLRIKLRANKLRANKLRANKPSGAVSDFEFFSQLMVDLLGLTYLLYLSGGANNPFVSYYLVPLCISAAVLPWRFTWAFAACALLAYSTLLFYFVPLPSLMPASHHHSSAASSLNLHIIGMWINFVVSTGLITYFVVKMAQALRDQERQLNQQIEARLRDDQLLAVASQAAGTAHELGTPLSTLTLLLEEMSHDDGADQHGADIALMNQQITECKRILQRLSTKAEYHNNAQLPPILASEFVQRTLTKWQVLTPFSHYTLSVESHPPPPYIKDDIALEQAMYNLLNNAQRASKAAIKLQLDWNKHHVVITITDSGPGFPDAILKAAGTSLSQHSLDGMGLGIMLSIANIERLGGKLTLSNTTQGASASIRIPCLQTNAAEPTNEQTSNNLQPSLTDDQ